MDKDVCFNLAVIVITLLAVLMVYQHFTLRKDRFSGTVIPGDLNLSVLQESVSSILNSNLNLVSGENNISDEPSQEQTEEVLTEEVNQEVEPFESLSPNERSKLVPPGLDKKVIYGFTADGRFVSSFDSLNNFTL